MTLSQLRQRGRYWQRRLSIQDWRIHFCFLPPEGMESPEHAGNATWDEDDETATVWINESIDEANIVPTLIHELIHIVLDGDGAVKPYCVRNETKINKIARALAPKLRGRE